MVLILGIFYAEDITQQVSANFELSLIAFRINGHASDF